MVKDKVDAIVEALKEEGLDVIAQESRSALREIETVWKQHYRSLSGPMYRLALLSLDKKGLDTKVKAEKDPVKKATAKAIRALNVFENVKARREAQGSAKDDFWRAVEELKRIAVTVISSAAARILSEAEERNKKGKES